MDLIKSSDFFREWVKIVEERKDALTREWRNARNYTNLILGNQESIIAEIGRRLNLLSYPSDYYSLDSILYHSADLVPGLKENTTFVHGISVAFEHENYFNYGLYQEVAHLLITSCDLRVLVTYPNSDVEIVLDYLFKIISTNRNSQAISESESFLIILGYENGFVWEGLVYQSDKWKRLSIS